MAIHSKVVVLGGGPGGYAAAFLAADLGTKSRKPAPQAR